MWVGNIFHPFVGVPPDRKYQTDSLIQGRDQLSPYILLNWVIKGHITSLK